MGDLYYDRQGQRISREECDRLWDDLAYRQVAEDEIGDGGVSTVWLGKYWMPDFSRDSGPPRLFETQVFGGALKGEVRRYPTEADALEGHAEVVRRVRESLS